MGLYASFDIPNTETPVLETIQYEFFRPFLIEEPELVDDRYSDFWVTDALLDDVEQTLLDGFGIPGIFPDPSIAHPIDDLRTTKDDDMEDKRRPHLYLDATDRLRQAIKEHGPLICSWSA